MSGTATPFAFVGPRAWIARRGGLRKPPPPPQPLAPAGGWLEPDVRVRDLVQPTLAPAPQGAPPIAALIEALAAVEARWFAKSWDDTPLMVTRLRKLYYGGCGWNLLLVPGTWLVPVPYRPLSPRVPAARIQEVALPDGSGVDVGHVLAGLDARQHPGEVGFPLPWHLTDNQDACTWLGDLGSALAEICHRAWQSGRPLGRAEVQAQIEACIPAQDLVGNADSYRWAAPQTLHGRVSELIATHYAAAAPTRYADFARAVGLGALQAGQFEHEAAWLARNLSQLRNAAAFYAAVTWPAKQALPLAWTLAEEDSVGPVAELLLAVFVDGVRKAQPP